DLSLRRSSTLLSDGNVRVQFNLDENIAMSLYAMEVLETFGDDMAVGNYRPEVAMKKQGNLFLVEPDGVVEAQTALERQQSMGCNVEWLDIETVRERFPPLYSDRFVGG